MDTPGPVVILSDMNETSLAMPLWPKSKMCRTKTKTSTKFKQRKNHKSSLLDPKRREKVSPMQVLLLKKSPYILPSAKNTELRA